MTEHTVVIEDGVVKFVYADDLAPLLQTGEATVVRASHVEPHPSRSGWIADMRPSGGPILGLHGEWQPQSSLPLDLIGDVEKHFVGMLEPFPLREDALAAEREWLRKEKGL